MLIDDETEADFGNDGSILKPDFKEFISIFAVFEKLSAGKHTFSLWGKANKGGSVSGVLVDPGGWGRRIIVKETW